MIVSLFIKHHNYFNQIPFATKPPIALLYAYGQNASTHNVSHFYHALLIVLCSFYKLDPLGVIASGALLLFVEPNYSERVTKNLRQAGIFTADIGCVKESDFGVRINRKGSLIDLPVFARDEIGKIFEA